ncbi:pullulanase-type alpha-1,6-glucosidase [Micromonospora sp. DT81.3]|uniref:pullulanase-type alpha-1,6-glucosidase n=1 Tax=Micromonospora sp. DT81.3 TaxID=3416523 RepID=UPI003CE90E3E
MSKSTNPARRLIGTLTAATMLLSAGVVSGVAPATAVESPLPETVAVTSDFNQEMGCATDWSTDCEKTALERRFDDGFWDATFDLAPGDYEYKIALNGTWDVNYGAGGVLNGANIRFSHSGGPVTIFYDPASHRAFSTSEEPIVTLAGSFQRSLGCRSDWAPDCLAAMLSDVDGDGVYEFSTTALPTGSHRVKVTHGLSWTENYGVDGLAGGADYLFTASEGKAVTFRYTVSTHRLAIEVVDAPMQGLGEERAHWIDATTLAWPADFGAPPTEASWQLLTSTQGITVAGGKVSGAVAVDLSIIASGLTPAQKQRFPALAGYVALRVPALSRAAVSTLLRGQVMLAQRDRAGALRAVTGVQLPGVLDDLYAANAAGARLGAVVESSRANLRLWAPTAVTATLLTWAPGGTGAPKRWTAQRDGATGIWAVSAAASTLKDQEYAWEVKVYAPSTTRFEINVVTDPYSTALTPNSRRSIVVDAVEARWRPTEWEKAPAPKIAQQVDRSIYELHVRDFSIGDQSVPEAERGTYLAFTRDSAGTRQLKQLAAAGMNTVHLLPTLDIATIEEDQGKQAATACDLESLAPASRAQQACVSATAASDGFNWGYDPYHFLAPEGAYAVDAYGGARVREFRSMVGALHGMGLQVVLDQVYNHTASSGQKTTSVLDKVVPGYYQRLAGDGSVQYSTCCENTATEHLMAQKLMVDSVVWWAKQYKVDGFRFDLMGHHSKQNMLAVRAALNQLTLSKDGVDGSAIYLYGEGWNFGEVANNALFEQATQGQLGGTGIGTFNDRLRDAVHGGSPGNDWSLRRQGFGTGLGTDPNGDPVNGTPQQALADLARATDIVKLGLAGNLRQFRFTTSDGAIRSGAQIDYNGSTAGYADEPDEVINYVDAHDNETLYDLSVFKLPIDTPLTDRARMNTLELATVTLSQAPSFWHAGTELLRSKSLDRNSYDSGDWFNRIDWTGQQSTFGSGLPPARDNRSRWETAAELLSDERLKPDAPAIAAAEASALDLLRVRREVSLLTLGSADLIAQKVTFPNGGPNATPGVIVMLVDDLVGLDTDHTLEGALVVFNASAEATAQVLPELTGRDFTLTDAQANGSDPIVKSTTWDSATGTVTVPARSVAVLVDPQSTAP